MLFGSRKKPQTGRILIIEDDWDILEVLKLMLEDAGHRVTTAPHGRAALAATASKTFDAVVMDISMPDMSGIEVARALRANPKTAELPIAIHTGLQEKWVRERFADYDLFLNKARDVDELVAGIGRLVAEPRAARREGRPAPTFTVEEAMRAQQALRQAIGLGPEIFPAEAFIGMLSDEIEQLRDIGRSDAEIAATIAQATGKDVTASLVEQHYAPAEARRPA